MFDTAQTKAIARYLEHRAKTADIEPIRRSAQQALDNYWLARARAT
jgi:hypothetical protein